MLFPVTVVKDKQKEKVLHAPDLKGWLDAGWKVEDTSEKKTPGRKPREETKEDPIKGLDI